MAFPNVVLLGVGKAGTTSIYYYAAQHPQVGVSKIREPKFLLYAGHLQNPIRHAVPHFRIRTVGEYEALYADCKDRRARLDISPTYLMFPDQTIHGIRRYVPEAKLVAIFRQPADRGYSNYVMHVRMGDEHLLNFADALQAEKDGLRREGGNVRSYFNRGFYYARTKRFLDEFPRERFLFLLYDDLVGDPQGFFGRLFGFMDVDPGFSPDRSRRHNPGAWPRRIAWHHLVTSMNPLKRKLAQLVPASVRMPLRQALRKGNLTAAPTLDPELRRRLTREYRDDILRLQDLIGRDLSAWTSCL